MKRPYILYGFSAAVCIGICVPLSKLLLTDMPPIFMAALLSLGAGVGMTAINLLRKKRVVEKESRITNNELPYMILMMVLDITAPILMMFGLSVTQPATASLLNNFEIVATAVIALLFFKEAISKCTWLAVFLITFSSVILSVDDFSDMRFSPGAFLIIGSCVCWGLENNVTRVLSPKDPVKIVMIKSIASGFGSLVIAILVGGVSLNIQYIAFALLLGFIVFGLSAALCILTQRYLGASRTSAFLALAPFIGAGFSFIIFREKPAFMFFIALIIMVFGAYLTVFGSSNTK